MQAPTTKTPVSKCIDLGAYSARMLVKFPAHPALIPLAARRCRASRRRSQRLTTLAQVGRNDLILIDCSIRLMIQSSLRWHGRKLFVRVPLSRTGRFWFPSECSSA